MIKGYQLTVALAYVVVNKDSNRNVQIHQGFDKAGESDNYRRTIETIGSENILFQANGLPKQRKDSLVSKLSEFQFLPFNDVKHRLEPVLTSLREEVPK